MFLSMLLQGIESVLPATDVFVTGLTLDSRTLQRGNLFFARQGKDHNGQQFIQEAIAKGASAVLLESSSPKDLDYTIQNGTAVIKIFNLNHVLASIAARFYGHPGQSLTIVGVTGTNGKTSTSHFIAALLTLLARPCGLIGTLGNGLYGALEPSALTTPDALTMQKILAQFVKQGARHVAMEVSSHSLQQGRVEHVPFTIGIFTNLTRDHLDYHLTMEAYGAAKAKLFMSPGLSYAIINSDDLFGRELIQRIQKQKNPPMIFATSAAIDSRFIPVAQGKHELGLIYIKELIMKSDGIEAQVITPWGEGLLRTGLMGQFNIHNLLAALTTLCLLDFPYSAVLAALSLLQPVSGRMQAFGGGVAPRVIVDYSHTPDALEQALTALRLHTQGQLYCVFGCGGDRDKGKRPAMAKIAEKIADVVVVTDDNPRKENPQQIVEDIFAGFLAPKKVILQHDRSKAIRDVIHYAKANDCILIAGKGAEAYQQVGDQNIPFSDIEQVQTHLQSGLFSDRSKQ